MVDSFGVRRWCGRSGDGEVPVEQVVGHRRGVDGRGRLGGLELVGFFLEAAG